ncbi:M15 family metallopeptidase [Nocardioides zeae]|uniref:M15 family metallopeptidase n=1 Tax=Nocardioides imazamoxiresistens TaxID=3231893 RepID=A0ABU3PRE3_9ACTN|nr:M15 family metallopeptidase [Nocardioides zeae]MDT9591800.1 M15 family metallopeptidase [Nocardioides zeae]
MAAASVLTVALVAGEVRRGAAPSVVADAPTTEAATGAPADLAADRPKRRPAGLASPHQDDTVAPFDLSARSTTDPASPWVVVNKQRPLDPLDFRPATTTVEGLEVAEVAAGPLADMLAAARAEGAPLGLTSAYRSFDHQSRIHADLVDDHGRAEAERLSARPGHSEHQTGLAVDVVDPGRRSCDLSACFAETPGGRWVAAEAWRFGFLVRYPAGAEAVTGYAPEPWHLRYVGTELAAELRRTGTATLEELFAVPGGGYPD